ncbi:MAG: uncharacterized protein K0S33_2530 [Bacteroidetes bacterium]|jgi:hypothetical protein|nr:uncharacterized protein [Bacteroidota bacterium]
MAIQSTKYFGEIDIDNTNEYYDSEITLNLKPVEVTIDFNVLRNIDKEYLNQIEIYIDSLKTHETSIRNLFQTDFKENGFAKAYVDALIEYQDMEELEVLTEKSNGNLSFDEKLLSELQLLRIVIYPDKDDNVFAVYDYTISEEITNDLLVVIVSKDGGIRLTIES